MSWIERKIKLKRLKKYKFKVVIVSSRASAMIRNHNTKYCRYYKPKTTVYADNSTYGIFVFKTRKEAIDWKSNVMKYSEISKVIRVLPIGRGKTPIVISRSLSSDGIDEHYKENTQTKTFYDIYPPKGTITYPAVYVVD